PRRDRSCRQTRRGCSRRPPGEVRGSWKLAMADLHVEERDIHPSAVLADTCRVVAQRLRIEAGARIGDDVQIVGGDVHLGPDCEIRRGASITAIDGLDLGRGSVLGPGLRASARRLTFGEFFWSTNRVVIGGGGWQGPDSVLTV